MDIFISNLLSKSIFDFWKWSNWKCANMRISVFSLWPLTKVKNWLQKQTWNKNVHISVLNFLFGCFAQYLKKSKNRFHIVFSKSDVALEGVNCEYRLWVLQSFWSIFYRKINHWVLLNFWYLDFCQFSDNPIQHHYTTPLYSLM